MISPLFSNPSASLHGTISGQGDMLGMKKQLLYDGHVI